jgi:hypothetical protein
VCVSESKHQEVNATTSGRSIRTIKTIKHDTVLLAVIRMQHADASGGIYGTVLHYFRLILVTSLRLNPPMRYYHIMQRNV